MKALYAMVGMQHRNALEFVASLPNGEPLTLVREPNNVFDPNAVQVWAQGRHIGFIKATQARALAIRMDRVPPANLPRSTLSVGLIGVLVKREHLPMIEVEE